MKLDWQPQPQPPLTLTLSAEEARNLANEIQDLQIKVGRPELTALETTIRQFLGLKK